MKSWSRLASTVILSFSVVSLGCQNELAGVEAGNATTVSPAIQANSPSPSGLPDGAEADSRPVTGEANGDAAPDAATLDDGSSDSPGAANGSNHVAAESSPKLADPANGNGSGSDDADSGDRKPASRRQPDGRTHVITFEDLRLDMPPDTVFRPELLTERAESLDGQRIRIKGFIYAAGIFQQTGITQFPLVMNTECKFGPGGEAFCVILVDLKKGVDTSFTVRPVTVEGVLRVDPFEGIDGNTWSVYRIEGDKVKH